MADPLATAFGWIETLFTHAADAVEVIQSVDPAVRALAGLLAALLELNVLTGLLVPGDTVILSLAAAVSTPAQGVSMVMAVTLGSIAGQSIGFGMGRWIGRRRWVDRLRGRAGLRRLEAAEEALERRGGPVVLAARFLPVLRTVVPFAVGMGNFPFRRFLGWAAPASLLWSVVFISVYSLATSSLRDGSATLGAIFAALGVALYVVTAIAQRLIVRERRPALAGEEA